MEAILQREIEKHQATVRIMEDENVTQRLQADHEIEVLRAKVSELELHVEAYDIVESANEALRERVDKLMKQLEQDNRAHAEEIHKVRLDMFNHKMALEKAFRKALQELDAEYLKKAFNAMSEESKNALAANAKLKDELQLQSIGVDNLMHRFNQQAKHYQKMKVENEILEQESQLRLQEVADIKKTNLQATRTIEKLKDDFTKEEHEWREQMQKTVEELQQENMHLRKLHETGQKRCNKWRMRCLELTEKEAKRRLEEQRAQTALVVAGTIGLPSSLPRAQSQPVLPSAPQGADDPRSYEEMWSASLKSSRGNLHETQNENTSTSSTAELERLVNATLNIRSRTASPGLVADSSARKPHRLPTSVLPRPGLSADSFNFTN
ncbi:TPA: hypothetical protein N0F65_006443 [Lagenidium giganteum]|uniref:Uncharacterized protein n=1 Tax=Lagenidium giganteum TaxID=4803 RepID=A0AAV2Z591_9STRA|nr:TPA: hypothetical protein N0F65_006443 [Lagenidium giganteum]